MNINPTGSVTPTSMSYHIATINVPKAELDVYFNSYWGHIKNHINPQIAAEALKGGYRELRMDRVVKAAGGMHVVFRDILYDAVGVFMKTQPRKALVVRDAHIKELITSYEITASVYLEPEVTWKDAVPGIDTDLVLKVPKLPEDVVARMVQDELSAAQAKSAILTPAVDNRLSPVDGQVSVVSVDSTIDGARWDDGCHIAKKWPMDRTYFKVVEMYDTLLTMRPDEKKTITFTLSDKFGELAGKSVEATIYLIQVFDKKTPEIDDDLAKSNGFDTLEAWKESLASKALVEVENTKETLLNNSIMAALLNTEVVDVEAVPQAWMAEKAREILDNAKAGGLAEDDVINQLRRANLTTISGVKVEDKNTAMLFLAEKATQQLVADLVFKAWGTKRGVPGSTALEDLPEYVKAVTQELKSVAKIEEVEETV